MPTTHAIKKFTLVELQSIPTLAQGHDADLKVHLPKEKVWLSRLTIEDGAPYNNMVTVERLINGVWKFAARYEAK